MPFFDGHVGRHLLETDFHAMLTAGSKGTALWRIQHIHRRAFDGNQPLIILRIDTGHGTQEPHGVGMGGIVEDVVHRSLLHNLSRIHDRNLVADFRHHPQIVGDEDDAHVGLFLQGLHQLQNLCLDGHVKGGGGLVGNQQLGMANQTHGNHHPLAHSARKLVGILPHPLLHVVYAHHLEHFHGTLCSLLLGNRLVVGPQCLNQLVPDGIHGIQAGHGILENHGHLLAPEGGQLLGGQGQHILSLKGDGAAHHLSRGLEQPHDGIGLLTLS